ncbi:hypothetical protein Ae201684P_019440 [Aphanomyces euteiches]|nr:hypothetical protein Ae201684P_019440 [Aphanomyces euteiches]KAH9142902.1 hypothetical protein AeRB84_013066 [Aphanomyces euteiches]
MLNLASRNEATYSAHSQLAALSTAVAPIAVTPNTPVPPRIRLDADETLGTMVHCGRCGRFRLGRNECHWASNNCSRCNTYGHSIWECGIPSDARRPPNQYDNGPRGSFNNRDRIGRSPRNSNSNRPPASNPSQATPDRSTSSNTNSQPTSPRRDNRCFICREEGHWWADCPTNPLPPQTIALIEQRAPNGTAF